MGVIRNRYEALITLNKSRLGILSWFLPSHCNLRKHLKILLTMEGNGVCRFYQEYEETSKHLLIQRDAVTGRKVSIFRFHLV